MSPRAACRLITLGFTDVYDYVAGKLDWLAHNQPVHGTEAGTPRIGQYLRQDVVTAGPDDLIGDIRERVAGSAHQFALITTADGILLGRLRGSTLDLPEPATPAADVMEPGPSTMRPHEPAAEVLRRLTDQGLRYAVITDPDGRLLGIVPKAELTPLPD
jgi:CBS-domain-containing membrane protein